VIRRLRATAVTDWRRVLLVEMMVNLLEGGFEDAAAGSLIGRVDEDVLPVSRRGPSGWRRLTRATDEAGARLGVSRLHLGE
jgi:hypothetical protein